MGNIYLEKIAEPINQYGRSRDFDTKVPGVPGKIDLRTPELGKTMRGALLQAREIIPSSPEYEDFFAKGLAHIQNNEVMNTTHDTHHVMHKHAPMMSTPELAFLGQKAFKPNALYQGMQAGFSNSLDARHPFPGHDFFKEKVVPYEMDLPETHPLHSKYVPPVETAEAVAKRGIPRSALIAGGLATAGLAGYGIHKYREKQASNIYLEKIAAKVVSQQDSSMVAKRDLERAKREALKDQELTPAQKNIKAKQEANAKAAKAPTVVTKPKPGANAKERMDNVLANQKASKAPTEHFTSANSVDYSKPVVAKPAPNAVVPKTNGPENRTLSLVPKEDAPSSSSTPKPKPSVKPKVGPEVEHQTADHLSAIRKMIPKSMMGKVGLGLAGLSAVGAVGATGYAMGHSKAAEREGLANFEIDDSVTSDKHSQDRAAKMYSMDDYKGGPMFISSDDGKENYRYHPKTGLHKLKSLSFEKAAEDDYLNKDTAIGGLLGYSAHHLTGSHGGAIPWTALGVAAGALGHVQKQRDELKKAQPITKAAALKNLGL